MIIIMNKNKLKTEDLRKYNFYDEETGRLHKLIRAEKDRGILLGYFDELIKNYDKMSSMIRPSWMERIAIKHLVRTREILRRSKHTIRPRDAPTTAELEELAENKEKLNEKLKEVLKGA